MSQITAIKKVNQAFNRWIPPKPLTLSQWADENFYLSPESSAEPGKWRSYPTQRAIMDAFTDPTIEIISWQKCARMGYTKIIGCSIGYYIEHDPCSQLVVQPTIDDGSGYSKEEIAPMIRDVKCLSDLVSDSKSRDSDNTIMKKRYPGGYLHIIGANSARGFRRITVRNVYFDEVDGYPPTAGHEGDQIKLGIKRTEYAWNRKIVIGSTPTIKGFSRIETSFKYSDQRYCYVPCPICGHMQTLKFKSMKWPKDNPLRAYFECEKCKKHIENKDKWSMFEKCEWRAEKKFNGHAGFFSWAAYSYSPNSTWGKIAERFADAKHEFDKTGDDKALRTVINTDLAETYEERGEGVEAIILKSNLTEIHNTIAPDGVLCITAGIDVQAGEKARIEMEIIGWGIGEESWSLDYKIISGNTELDSTWEKLSIQLTRTWDKDGIGIPISCACIDHGGTKGTTEAVERFVSKNQHRGIYAVKGKSTAGSPIIGRPSRASIKRQLLLFPIGTDTAKDTILARLKLQKPGPGYCHFPLDRENEYFEQLTSEKVIAQYKKGIVKRVYKKTRRRNEALDCRVYGYAALKILINKRNSDDYFNSLQTKLLNIIAAKRAGIPIPNKKTRRIRSRGISG